MIAKIGNVFQAGSQAGFFQHFADAGGFTIFVRLSISGREFDERTFTGQACWLNNHDEVAIRIFWYHDSGRVFVDILTWLDSTIRVFEGLAHELVEAVAICGYADWDSFTGAKIVVELLEACDFLNFHRKILLVDIKELGSVYLFIVAQIS